MPSKRDPGKQGRQARNQAQRRSLAVRRDHAVAAPEAAVGGTGPADDAAAPPTTAATGGGWRSGASRASGGGSSATGRAPGGRLAATGRPVGWRSSLVAVLLAVIGLVTLTVQKVDVDQDGDAVPLIEQTAGYQVAQAGLGQAITDAYGDRSPSAEVAANLARMRSGPGDDKESSFSAYFPLSIAFPLPVLITALAFWTVHRGLARSRQMLVSLLAMFLVSMLTGFVYLPALIALGVANFGVRKQAATAAIAARGGASPGGAGSVIDVDAVDDDGPIR